MDFNIRYAKTHLSKLLQRAEAGEEITIARHGVPVARLVPVAKPAQRRQLGMYRDHVWIADDFDAPLPDDIVAAFEGRVPKRIEI
ncbi:MAG TPA: type II toxin-antitoxin system Phd/YefM family antitoxin [Candidatus Angelobacter sp.]|nr:type II toxin-antitoxin system Phd/YefM family antitoxin [Candidatus Angelobacter sp.]